MDIRQEMIKGSFASYSDVLSSRKSCLTSFFSVTFANINTLQSLIVQMLLCSNTLCTAKCKAPGVDKKKCTHKYMLSQ